MMAKVVMMIYKSLSQQFCTVTFAFCVLSKDETKIFDSVAQDDLVGPMLHADATLS